MHSIQLQVLCTPTIAFEPGTDREVQVMGQLAKIRSLGVATSDRDLNNWWAEYDQMMGNYTLLRNASICTDPDVLQTRLKTIKTQVEKV